jgi:hypothetical protein
VDLAPDRPHRIARTARRAVVASGMMTLAAACACLLVAGAVFVWRTLGDLVAMGRAARCQRPSPP